MRGTGGIALLGTQALAAPATREASAHCSLVPLQTQICPTRFKASAGKSAQYVVATYGDFSHCNQAAPIGEPGANGNYVVASVTINWGDGTKQSAGGARTGTTCTGTSPQDTPGEPEPVTGTHKYKKRGAYTASVWLTYVRGAGNTYPSCAVSTPGSTTYNVLTNCIALGSPARSTATATESGTVPKLKGKTLAQIKKALQGAKCVLGKVTRRRSSTVAKGHEISQSPAARKHDRTGVVEVVVSRGPK